MEKMHVIGRTDLGIGLFTAQVVHAARQLQHEHPEVEAAWFQDSNNVAVLGVPDEVALEGTLPESVRADQSVDGAIETRRVPDALSLPRPAGLPLHGPAPLYRVDPSTLAATRVDVTVGLVPSDRAQILAGLAEGEAVILSDMSRYAEHELVQLE